MTAQERTEVSMTHAEFERQVKRVALLLRSYADRVESEGRVSSRGPTPHQHAAADVMSVIQSMLGNAPLWPLLMAAADADTAAISAAGVSG